MAGPDYDKDRKNETWREDHGWTRESRTRRDNRRAARQRNREVALLEKINWNSYEHYQLYDMIMSARPKAMVQQSDQWRDLARNIQDTTNKVQKTLRDLMNVWHGTAAVAAAGSVTRLMQWADDASHTATRIAANLADYTEAVSTAQHRMPSPGFTDAEFNFRNGYTVQGSGGPSTAILIDRLLTDHIVGEQRSRELKAEAVRVMSDYEEQSRDVHRKLPDFEPAGTPVTNTGVQDPVPRPVPPDEGSVPGGGAQGSAPGLSGGSGVPGDIDGDGIADSTTPGGYGPASNPGGTGYGGLPGTGSGIDTTRGGPGPGPGGGGAAGGIAGGQLAARGGAGVVGGAAFGPAGARGPGGAGMAGGFYPPMGAGAGMVGQEDAEHKNKYDEGLDLFDDLPPAYPPVFGA